MGVMSERRLSRQKTHELKPEFYTLQTLPDVGLGYLRGETTFPSLQPVTLCTIAAHVLREPPGQCASFFLLQV